MDDAPLFFHAFKEFQIIIRNLSTLFKTLLTYDFTMYTTDGSIRSWKNDVIRSDLDTPFWIQRAYLSADDDIFYIGILSGPSHSILGDNIRLVIAINDRWIIARDTSSGKMDFQMGILGLIKFLFDLRSGSQTIVIFQNLL